MRDHDGRTYAGAAVDLPSLQVSAVGVAVAMAVSSGAQGLEAVALVTDADAVPRATSPRCATSPAPASRCCRADAARSGRTRR